MVPRANVDTAHPDVPSVRYSMSDTLFRAARARVAGTRTGRYSTASAYTLGCADHGKVIHSGVSRQLKSGRTMLRGLV